MIELPVSQRQQKVGLLQRIRCSLNTGDFERDFRVWIVLGVALLLSAATLVLAVQDLLREHYLAALLIGAFPLLMLLAIWLLIWWQMLEVAAAIVIVSALFTASAMLIASGGRATGAYVFLPTIVLVSITVSRQPIFLLVAIVSVLLPLVGIWLYSGPWAFPMPFDESRMVWGAVRSSVITGVISFSCIFLYTKAADRMRRQLVHAQAIASQDQKMKAIGTLAAGIAHEINTPVQYVTDNTAFIDEICCELRDALESIAQLVENCSAADTEQLKKDVSSVLKEADIDYMREELPRAVGDSKEGLKRIKTIVQAMKEFAHPGHEDKSLVCMNQAIESTLAVCENRWRYTARVETDFDPSLPATECMIAEVNQVILNIIINAADSIQDRIDEGDYEKGEIRIATRKDGDSVKLEISDNGKGIPDEIRERVFDPFFTTKEVGKGSGQGLAISYDVIVNRHGGELTCDSEPGQGTTFRIRLPISAEGSGSQVEATPSYA